MGEPPVRMRPTPRARPYDIIPAGLPLVFDERAYSKMPDPRLLSRQTLQCVNPITGLTMSHLVVFIHPQQDDISPPFGGDIIVPGYRLHRRISTQ